MKLCLNLSYLRSLNPGKATFYYFDKNDETNDPKHAKPLQIDKTRIRAAKGGYTEAFSGDNVTPKDVDSHALAFSNPQYIEECYAPFGIDRVHCQFSLRIISNSLKPEVCSSDDVREKLSRLAELYKALHGYDELAKRIAKNILMGTWLWRNRHCRGVSIEVVTSEMQKIRVENAYSLSWSSNWELSHSKELKDLTAFLAKALTTNDDCYYMDVTATLDVGFGDEIYPSQEFLDEKDKKDSSKPSKRLAQTNLPNGEKTAAFHAQKIGAALQMIDDWYSDDGDKPLRINEYGADREYMVARRHPMDENQNTFYQLIINLEKHINDLQAILKKVQQNHSKIPKHISSDIPKDVHFIMSVLLKGGLLQCESPKKKKAKGKNEDKKEQA